MPILLWLLGVPVSLIILLMIFKRPARGRVETKRHRTGGADGIWSRSAIVAAGCATADHYTFGALHASLMQ